MLNILGCHIFHNFSIILLIIGYWLVRSIIDRAKMVHIQANIFVCMKSSTKEKLIKYNVLFKLSVADCKPIDEAANRPVQVHI